MHESDISWHVLRRITQEWAGDSAELADVRPLDGGCISTTLALHTSDDRRAVLKISQHRVDRSYADESCNLKLIKSLGIPAPEVYACKTGSLDDPFSYLLLEHMRGMDLHATRHHATPEQFDTLQGELAEIVLRLHEQTGPHYMRLTAEEGAADDNWPRFFRNAFDPIWHGVEKTSLLPIKSRKMIAKVHERLDTLIDHDDQPRLVHWDCWASNLLAESNGDGNWHLTAVLDPMCKYAHAEAELAYMELFHTITPAFLKAYQQVRKLSPEYHRVRKHVYQMYFLLNDVYSFGQEYMKALMMTLDRVAPLVQGRKSCRMVVGAIHVIR